MFHCINVILDVSPKIPSEKKYTEVKQLLTVKNSTVITRSIAQTIWPHAEISDCILVLDCISTNQSSV